MRTAAALLTVLCLSLSLPFPAEAKSRRSHATSRTPEQVWSSAVRFVRVDLDCQLIDKDAEAGYVIFSYKAGPGRELRASIEIIATSTADKSSELQIQVNVPDGTTVDENLILTRLFEKLREEGG